MTCLGGEGFCSTKHQTIKTGSSYLKLVSLALCARRVKLEEQNPDVDVFFIPSIKHKIVDAIGCADAITGGMTAALSLRLPMRYALLWGAAVGALSMAAVGAQESMPTKAQLKRFMFEKRLMVDPSVALSAADLWNAECPAVLKKHRHLHFVSESGPTPSCAFPPICSCRWCGPLNLWT